MGRLAIQNMHRTWMRTHHSYRCQATTKAGTRCKRRGPNGYCHLHRLPSVDEELAAEKAARGDKP